MSQLTTMYPAQTDSPHTTTLGEISTTDTAVVVADASVLPSELPFLLTLGYDKSASETVLVTEASGNTLTITRGVDGNALLWVAGTKVARVFTAKDLNDVQNNLRLLNEEKQEKPTVKTATLSASNWSSSKKQTVTVEGVTAANNVVVAPVPASLLNYCSAGVYCSSQSSGKLTFSAEVTPDTALTVNVMIYD